MLAKNSWFSLSPTPNAESLVAFVRLGDRCFVRGASSDSKVQNQIIFKFRKLSCESVCNTPCNVLY